MAEVAHSVSIARSARPARPHSGQGERVLRWSVALLGVGIAVWRILLGLAQATEDPVDAAEFVRATAPLEAVALARQALAEQPLDGRGYRVLAESRLDAAGAPDPALLATALQYAPRDAQARLLAALAAEAAGDPATAVRHLDRLLRVAPLASEALYPQLRADIESAGGLAALVRALRVHPPPPWRTGFLDYATRTATSPAALNRLFRALAAVAALPRLEASWWVQRLVALGDVAGAAAAWQVYRPQPAVRERVFDRDFAELQPIPVPFEWVASTGTGVEVAPTVGVAGVPGAVRVTFTGSRANFPLLTQLLQLPSATPLQLVWTDTLLDLQTPRGIHWTLRCASGLPADLLAAPAQRGNAAWQRHAVAFTVPNDCSAQWLRLELDARIAAESEAVGQYTVRGVGVQDAH